MTFQIRRASDRGRTQIGWLDSYHTFSFGDYHDPEWMAFESLRVINDDIVAPGGGFSTHGHRDMEIITYILEGALEHKDSIGTGSVIRPGELQKMSAGRGILHSEFNASRESKVHLLQIWILPSQRGLDPGYQQITLAPTVAGTARLAASSDGRDGTIHVHQNCELWIGNSDRGKPVNATLAGGRPAWIHVARGNVKIKNQEMREGDSAGLRGESSLEIQSDAPAEFLIFKF